MSSIASSQAPTRNEPLKGLNPRILLLALGMFALGTDAFVVAGVLPTIAGEVKVTESLAGQLVTAFSLTYGLGAPLLAALTSRWSPNRVLLLALGFFCFANIGSAIAPTFPLLMLSRVLTGCFAASYAPLAYTIATSMAPPEKRGQALSLVVIGTKVATVIGSPLGTWIGEHIGWRMSFGLVALLAGIALIALLIFRLPSTAAPIRLSLGARLAPITQPRLVLALLPALLWNLGTFAVYTYIAPLLQATVHIKDVSGLLMAFGVGMICGNLLAGRIVDRLGSNRPLVFFLIALIVVQSFLALATTTLIGSIISIFIWALLTSITFIPQQYRMLHLAPEHANVILALNNSTLYLGIAAGAGLGGLALHIVPVTQLGLLGSGVLLLSLLLFGLSIRLSDGKASQDEEHAREKILVTPE
ncbi:MFS transporter [Ktedonospora formicarum]|uniref:MFS transporter n=1 Tax=Ktedonospora formicarum TaxID=2778364 RepID=A0A8J3MVM8_9CHLR|nr:MFS transporter [Ktedonospora formicarum]GHO46670.1 MFS transporter [Ktedonospora formicarum]